MEDKIKNLSQIYEYNESYAYITLHNKDDIKLFNIEELKLNILYNYFDNWVEFDSKMTDPEYISTSPQVKIRYNKNGACIITFEFYGYDELQNTFIEQISEKSFKQILENLDNNNVKITNYLLEPL